MSQRRPPAQSTPRDFRAAPNIGLEVLGKGPGSTSGPVLSGLARKVMVASIDWEQNGGQAAKHALNPKDQGQWGQPGGGCHCVNLFSFYISAALVILVKDGQGATENPYMAGWETTRSDGP